MCMLNMCFAEMSYAYKWWNVCKAQVLEHIYFCEWVFLQSRCFQSTVTLNKLNYMIVSFLFFFTRSFIRLNLLCPVIFCFYFLFLSVMYECNPWLNIVSPKSTLILLQWPLTYRNHRGLRTVWLLGRPGRWGGCLQSGSHVLLPRSQPHTGDDLQERRHEKIGSVGVSWWRGFHFYLNCKL